MILAAVVVAKDGSDTGGKAKVDRGQQPLRIQSDGDSSDTGFSQIVQHGQIKEEGGHCVGKIGDHFRGTVGADVSQCGSIKYRLYKKEAAAPINKKEDQTKDGGNTVADSGSIGGAFDAERKDDDEQKVKKDVGDTGKDGDSQPQMRSAGGDEKGLKKQLKDSKRGKQHQRVKILIAVGVQRRSGAHQVDERTGEQGADQRHDDSEQNADQHHH